VSITRRGFISMLALVGNGAVLIPNRKFFLPPRGPLLKGYERYSMAWMGTMEILDERVRGYCAPT
jgi:hypothetical protein